MIKLYFSLLAFILSIIGLYFYETNWRTYEHHEIIHDLLIGFPFATGGYLFNFISEHKGALLLAIKCQFKRNDEIYVSLSYLFRIKTKGDNMYLMVKGNKIPNQYQPVGGVYQKFPSITEKWRKWGASETNNDRHNSDDLRFKVKRKFIPEIRKWFYKKENREVDVWREFCEELLSTGILPKALFEHIKPEFLYSIEEPLIFRKGQSIKQFLIYDVFTINFTSEQENAINNLLNESLITDKYAFVNENELDKELFYINKTEYQLGFHARYLKPQLSC